METQVIASAGLGLRPLVGAGAGHSPTAVCWSCPSSPHCSHGAIGQLCADSLCHSHRQRVGCWQPRSQGTINSSTAFIGNYCWRSHISSEPKFQEKKLFLCNCCLNVGRCPMEQFAAMWLGGEREKKKSRTSPSHIQHPEHATCRSALRLLTFLIHNKIRVPPGHLRFSAAQPSTGAKGAQGAAQPSAGVWNYRTHICLWTWASWWAGDLIKLEQTSCNQIQQLCYHCWVQNHTRWHLRKIQVGLPDSSPEIKAQQCSPERSTLGKAQPKGF